MLSIVDSPTTASSVDCSNDTPDKTAHSVIVEGKDSTVADASTNLEKIIKLQRSNLVDTIGL